MTTQRERRGVFGEAEDYEKARPGYPAALVDDVLAAAGPGPALEAGAGVPADTTAVIDARGGEITGVVYSDLALARRV
jgi:hypothetical protein